jgi:hypothetical protein
MWVMRWMATVGYLVSYERFRGFGDGFNSFFALLGLPFCVHNIVSPARLYRACFSCICFPCIGVRSFLN